MDNYTKLKNKIFYQVYPASFFDSNGDGIGDIQGIIKKLEYIKDLGADGIWLNPCFLSEFRDGGYDVIDYRKVDPRFGTNDDLKQLFIEARKLGIIVLLDLVIGHSSEKCSWFLESKKKSKNKYSDYYIWTNSAFDDSAELRTINGVCERNGNYVVNFFAMQPALNFGFAEIKRSWQKLWTDESFDALHNEFVDIMEYFLELGADGFRIDMASSLVKYDYEGKNNARLWRKLIGKVRMNYPDAVFVSEWSYPEIAVGEAGFDIDFLIHIRGEAYNSLFRAEGSRRAWGFGDSPSYFGLNTPTNLSIFFNDFIRGLEAVKQKGYISVPSGNHDVIRLADGRSVDEVKSIFAFLLTLPSIPFIYYGDELGMRHLPNLSKDGGYNRTGSRTPMQWSDGVNAGFSQADAAALYLPVEISSSVNAAAQIHDSDSLRATVKELIAIRKTQAALGADTDINIISKYNEIPFMYERIGGGEKVIVVINAKGGKKDMPFAYSGEVLKCNNCVLNDKLLTFDGFGFMVFKTK